MASRSLLGFDVDKVKGEIDSLQNKIKGFQTENAAAPFTPETPLLVMPMTGASMPHSNSLTSRSRT